MPSHLTEEVVNYKSLNLLRKMGSVFCQVKRSKSCINGADIFSELAPQADLAKR